MESVRKDLKRQRMEQQKLTRKERMSQLELARLRKEGEKLKCLNLELEVERDKLNDDKLELRKNTVRVKKWVPVISELRKKRLRKVIGNIETPWPGMCENSKTVYLRHNLRNGHVFSIRFL